MTRNQRLILRLLLAFVLGYSMVMLGTQVARADGGIDGGTNAYRQSNGLGTVSPSATLAALAAQRAQQIYSPDMGANFYHDFWWWGASGCQGIGENLVYRIPAPDDPSGYAVSSWIDSAPHRANLLGDWDVMGSAIFIAPDGGMYAAQLFGNDCGLDIEPSQLIQKPTPQPTPVPVQNPPVGQPTKPTVVQPPVQLPNTSMELP